MTFFAPIADLIDTLALSLAQGADAVADSRTDEPGTTRATVSSERLFGSAHSHATAKALSSFVDALQTRAPHALTSRQVHVLIAAAAAEMLGPNHLPTFLDSYLDPGVDVAYQPISVTGLRQALTEVFTPYQPAQRARLLTDLAAHVNEELIRWAPTDTSFALEFLTQQADNLSVSVRRQVARNPHTDPNVLALLAADHDRFIRIAVADNSATSGNTLDELAADHDPEVRSQVARSPNTPATTLAHLAEASTAIIRIGVARNPSAPPETLAALAHDRTTAVRVGVAENPNADLRTLTDLTSDSARSVLLALSRNPSLTPELLATLARNKDRDVRAAVASNKITSAALLAQLGSDSHDLVRKVIAQRTDVHESVLATLAADPEWHVRLAVARNTHADTTTLASLGARNEWDVRRAVAQNPATDVATLATLVEDREWTVREAVAENRLCPPMLLARLARDEEPYVRIATARHPHTDTTTLAELSRDREQAVRRQLVNHPNLDEEHRRRLDPDRNAIGRPTAVGAAAEVDPHTRYDMALDVSLGKHRIILSPFIEHLSEALTAIRAEAKPRTRSARSISSLPNLDDLTFPTATDAQGRFEEAPIPVQVLKNGFEQRRNGVEMDICTFAGSYIAACQRGTVIVATFEFEHQRYTISWRFADEAWRIGDLRGVGNTMPPPEVEAVAAQLTEYLDRLEPHRNFTIDARATLGEIVIGAVPHSARSLAFEFAFDR